MPNTLTLLTLMAAASALVPETIGVVGVGTISSAAVRGLSEQSGPSAPAFVLSPRNAAKAKALDDAYANVEVAADNQAVVDGCDCILLAVLPGQAEAVCEPLKFREGQAKLRGAR